eukprot:XP_014786739.1 PREDICTED: uncharacterized protein LOC106881048 isoform X1 [Octopus bimaculoides]
MEDACGRNCDRTVHLQTRTGEPFHRPSCFQDSSGEEELAAKSVCEKMEGNRKKDEYARSHANTAGPGIEKKKTQKKGNQPAVFQHRVDAGLLSYCSWTHNILVFRARTGETTQNVILSFSTSEADDDDDDDDTEYQRWMLPKPPPVIQSQIRITGYSLQLKKFERNSLSRGKCCTLYCS